MGVAEEARLPTAEAVVAHRHGDRDVDPDHADLDVELELARRAAVAREQRDAVGVRVGVDQVDPLLVPGDADDRQHRPEDLVVVAGHAGLDVVDQRRVQEEALVGRRPVAAVDDQPCSRRGSALEIARHLVAVLTGDQRAHLVVGLVARTDLDVGDAVGDLADQLVVDRVGREQDADRHAPLAGRTVRGADGRVGGHVEVGVGEHEHVVLGAAEGLHALAVRRPGLVDVLGDRRGADEADRRDVGMLEQPVDGHLVALHDVEAPVGQTGVVQQLGHEQRRRRILLARLEHERVAARQGVGEHPHRDHRREVERRDAGHDTERLADRVDVDTGCGLLAVPALQQVRDAARELDVLEPSGDLAHRVGQHLAVLGGEQRGDLLAVGVDQLAHAEQDLGAPRQAGGPPRGERRLGRGDGRVDLVGRRQVDGARLLTGGRVVDDAGATRRPGDDRATDPVRDSIHAAPPC